MQVGRSPRILFVDEDAGTRYATARQLENTGFTVDEADTGAKALAKLTPAYDVVILDLRLHDMRGSEVCKHIKANPTTSTVMVLELSETAAGNAHDRAQALELGADAYLARPIAIVELVATIRALVRLRHAVLQREQDRELFLASISHDLRNPLSTMTVAGQALAMSPDLSDGQRGLLATMFRSGMRMQRLIELLLVYTQSVTGGLALAFESLDLAGLAHTVIADLTTATERAIELEAPATFLIEGDPDRLGQLLDNLIANAIRHGEGTVTVRITRSARHATISVHNAGTPIDPDALATLFDPFKRGSRRRGSFGLGLYIAERITRAHGGTIRVTSTPQDGTTFTVTLPVTRG